VLCGVPRKIARPGPDVMSHSHQQQGDAAARGQFVAKRQTRVSCRVQPASRHSTDTVDMNRLKENIASPVSRDSAGVPVHNFVAGSSGWGFLFLHLHLHSIYNNEAIVYNYIR